MPINALSGLSVLLGPFLMIVPDLAWQSDRVAPLGFQTLSLLTMLLPKEPLWPVIFITVGIDDHFATTWYH